MTERIRSAQHNYSRLPKLVLPTFNGNPLQWQTFWDSFKAAVDSNPCLSQVQKFSYPCAQLQGDAAHIISGLPLTENNYMHSIALLTERFGQQYKLVDAHMEALLNVPSPLKTLTSLQSFYDTIQNYMRSLSALESHLILMAVSLPQLFWVSYQLKSRHEWLETTMMSSGQLMH